MKLNQRGYAIVLMAMFVTFILGYFMILLIDLGRAYITSTQMSAVADAASLAAMSGYANDASCAFCNQAPCKNLPAASAQQCSRVQSAYQLAQKVADANPIFSVKGGGTAVPPHEDPGLNLGVQNGIHLGHYDSGNFTEVTGNDLNDPNNATYINAARVDLVLGQYGNGKLPMMFSGMVPGFSKKLTMTTNATSSINMDRIPLDIVFMLDASGSMATIDGFSGLTCYDATRRSAKYLVNYLKTHQGNRDSTHRDKIGFVFFNDTYFSPSLINQDTYHLTSSDSGYNDAINMLNDYSYNRLYEQLGKAIRGYPGSIWDSGWGWPSGQDYLPPNVVGKWAATGIRRSTSADMCYNGGSGGASCGSGVLHVGTNIEMSLARAFYMVQYSKKMEIDANNPRQRVIILITDGIPAQSYRNVPYSQGAFGSEPFQYGVPSNYVGVPRQASSTDCNMCSPQDTLNYPSSRAIAERNAKISVSDTGSGSQKKGIILYTLRIGTNSQGDVFLSQIAGDKGRAPQLGGTFFNVAEISDEIQQILDSITKGGLHIAK